ncbi:SAM-dependent methyltransferase [Actinacidiphila paucisporea]|uniref:S-adenosyl-L-methionine-dependent methyltransferase n=1 Tax=Actinacidiphila paucisporea TaxID=310782 RepID=A0A1M7FPY1_9ACTN|nr:SAM-dependent methyltransferase [Actinacidiphila paucisporea]SHM05717.1 methyltransferase, TIGR00027 family [Actinacidiphila paucisporea]
MRSGLARTAIEVAQVRAKESAREDRLFDDQFAGIFLRTALGDEPEAEEQTPELAAWKAVIEFNVVIRTRFFDDYLTESAAAGCRQVVILGAGLDVRAYRLEWPPETRVFEVDLAEVLEFKQEVLDAEGAKPGCIRVPVPADLRESWQDDLKAAGYDPTVRTAWLVEGLLIYLTAQEAAALLETIGALSPAGSRITFEHANTGRASAATEAKAVPALAKLNELVKGGLGDQTLEWLAEHGWDPALHDRAEAAAGYGRPVTGRPNGGLATAVRTA